MWEILIQKDKELLIYLNSLGSEQWDFLWLSITNQFYWSPLFAFIFYLVINAFGWKKGLFTILVMIILVAFSDQFTNFIKDYFMRYRPNNNPNLQAQLRTLISPRGNSFYSGHAATSSAFTVFTILILKHKYNAIYLLLLFPFVFGYSRLYLGVHFPIDVFTGFVAGTMVGTLFYCVNNFLQQKIFDKKRSLT